MTLAAERPPVARRRPLATTITPASVHAALRAVLPGVAYAVVILLLLPARVDTDLWGHLRFGQDLLSSGAVPWGDSYSYLAGGSRWINHELLSEAAFAFVFDAFGGAGLVLLKLAVLLIIGVLIIRRLHAAGCGSLRAAALLLAATILALSRFVTIRPQLFSALFFAITLTVLLRAEHGGNKWLWWLPPLFAVWVNTHGGVLAGLGAVLAWATVRAGRRREIELQVAMPVLAACAALAANPYGLSLPAFLLRTGTVPRPDVAEWQPIAIASPQGLAYLALAGLLGWGALRRRARLPLERGVLLLAVMLLPLLATRHADLCAIGALLLGAELLARPGGADRARARRAVEAAAPAVVAALLVLGFTWPAGGGGCVGVDPSKSPFPVRAVAALRGADVRANMVAPLAWAEYVIWELGPQVKVAVDGRRETLYPARTLDAALRLEAGRGDWGELLRDPRADLVLTAVGSPTFNLLREHGGWEEAYSDGTAALFARTETSAASRLRAAATQPSPAWRGAPADGAGVCLAAPRETR